MRKNYLTDTWSLIPVESDVKIIDNKHVDSRSAKCSTDFWFVLSCHRNVVEWATYNQVDKFHITICIYFFVLFLYLIFL